MTIDCEYFSTCNQEFGYRFESYRNFPGCANFALEVSYKTPSSAIDFGGARGYTARTLDDMFGVPTTVMEKSHHCYHTRAVKDFVLHDMYDIPYPFEDKQFDLAYSNSVLEHLDYEHLNGVIREMARVSKRGYHAVGFIDEKKDYNGAAADFFSDGTHIVFEKFEWWKNKFRDVVPGYDVELFNAYTGMEMRVPMIKNEYVCLNLGCGANIFGSGWINIDNRDLSQMCHPPYKFELCDITNFIPHVTGTADMIFLGNILETMDNERGMELLKACYNLLKPGGIIRISVVDSENLMRRYLNDDIDFLKHIHPGSELAPCGIIKLAYAMFAGAGSIYDRCLLKEVLKRSGFTRMTETNPFDSTNAFMKKTTLISYPTISVVMEATK